MGVPDKIVTHGDPKFLLSEYGLNADGIFNKVKKSLAAHAEQNSNNKRLRMVK